LLGGLIGEAFAGCGFGLIFGVVFGVTFGIRSSELSLANDIQTVEALSWSWSRALKFGTFGLAGGVIFGLGVELTYRVIVGGPILDYPEWWLATGLLMGTVGGLSGAIVGGLSYTLVETKIMPNQGIVLSLRNALLAGLIAGSIIGLFGGLLGDFFGGLISSLSDQLIEVSGGLSSGLVYGVSGGSLVALWYGGLDVIQHYVLRAILYVQGYTPRNYTHFLNYAADHIFLRQVGNGYIFIHRLLLEHFATLELNETKK
jgi:hypothetical protein